MRGRSCFRSRHRPDNFSATGRRAPRQFDGTFAIERLPVGHDYAIYAEPLVGLATPGHFGVALQDLCSSGGASECATPEELVEYLNSSLDDDHALVKAAMAHLNLTMIHPFSDGNGRMARCLQTLVLAAIGIVDPTFCSIEEYLGRNTQDYYEILADVGRGKWNPHRDSRPWIRFNLTAHYRQAGTLVRRAEMIKTLWDELERVIAKRRLPERVIGALADAAMGYRVRSATYRHFADVSKVVASRDLRAVVESGLLIPTGERRGRIYRASDEIRALSIKIRGSQPKGIPDPFQKGITLIQ